MNAWKKSPSGCPYPFDPLSHPDRSVRTESGTCPCRPKMGADRRSLPSAPPVFPARKQAMQRHLLPTPHLLAAATVVACLLSSPGVMCLNLRPHGWLELYGKVTRIVDGNNFRLVDDSSTEHQVRLMYAETPEMTQPYGYKAKKTMERLLLGKRVRVVHKYFDGHGRILGRVYLNQDYINLRLVREGLAWARPDAPEEFRKAMEEARKARRGLWKSEHPIPPWFWRRGTRVYRPGIENKPYPLELPYSPSSNERALIGVPW